MPEQLHLKVKGPRTLIESFLESLKLTYVVVPTSAIKTPPGEEPHIYLTVVEVPQ